MPITNGMYLRSLVWDWMSNIASSDNNKQDRINDIRHWNSAWWTLLSEPIISAVNNAPVFAPGVLVSALSVRIAYFSYSVIW